MMRRRRGPGLVGMAARTAVVAGTATAVSGRVARRQAGKYEQQQEAPAEQQDETPAPPPPPAAAEPAAMSPEVLAQLKQLGDLHSQGVLTDEEFATQKARLLG